MKNKINIIMIFTATLFALLFFNEEAFAAKVKLNVKNQSVEVGKIKTIKLLNNKKKVKWKVSNKNIKITKKAKQYAKIKGIKKGKSTLTAKIGKKKYKCKISVKEAKTKIEYTKQSIYIGEEFDLRLLNPKGKVKWSVTNSCVGISRKTGKYVIVKGLRYGTAYIKATNNGKTYKCKVTVKKINYEKAKKWIWYEWETTNNSVIGTFENGNEFDVDLNVKIIFYDSFGNMIDYSEKNCYCLGAGNTCAFEFSKPTDTNYNYVNYDRAEFQITTSQSFYKDCSENISAYGNFGSNSFMVKVSNTGSKELDTIQVAVIFYDFFGNIVGYNYGYADCEKAGTTDIVSLSYPYDSNYQKIIPKNYEIYINHAYSY